MEEFKFYQTYYFCNVINNVLRDQFSYIRKLNDFYDDCKTFYFLGKFQKESIFHEFIEFIVSGIYDEHLDQFDLHESIKLPIERAFEYYDVTYITFQEFYHEDGLHEHIDAEQGCYDYMEFLKSTGAYNLLLQKTTNEIFYILFQNRDLLMVFNQKIADIFETENKSDCPKQLLHLMTANGFAKRKPIPVWVKNAVYFRDRGRCVLCNMDLSGILNLDNKNNFDHIVPLARFGFNDVTNIQLLCHGCNQKKLAGKAVTSTKTQPWYK
ncbi:HNH endonuclease [Idiomarina abyssalis]|uniref:HNH endonuclease n=1 Tax=Idiomarina abyssalis TaxID=86102 RepID=UPI003A8E896F